MQDFTAKEQIFLLDIMIGICGYFWIGRPYTVKPINSISPLIMSAPLIFDKEISNTSINNVRTQNSVTKKTMEKTYNKHGHVTAFSIKRDNL